MITGKHLYYITYGAVCTLPFYAYLESMLDIRYLYVLLPLILAVNYLSLVMLHYKQPHIFYFINVATGFVLYFYAASLGISGFNSAAYILSAIIVQFILFAIGYFIASICDVI